MQRHKAHLRGGRDARRRRHRPALNRHVRANAFTIALLRRLLAAGHTVHGTVRDVAKATEDLSVLEGAKERLKLFKADLLSPDGFKEAAQVSPTASWVRRSMSSCGASLSMR